MNELPHKPQLNIPVVNAQPFFHGSLFSGIGGFDLAAEWAGWQNAFHCEWNEFGQKILKHYWPKAISYGDITKTDFTIHRGTIDVLTGGFPCQPYSTAGKRLGKADERHLWPEMLRAIREIQPSYIVGENVYGLVNWNGGMVFNEVQTDLENEGYEIQPVILPACAVNAPHRRERVWFVAYSDNTGDNTRKCGNIGNRTKDSTERKYTQYELGGQSLQGIDSDTGLQRQAERQKQTMGINELCQERNVTNASSPGARMEKQNTDYEKRGISDTPESAMVRQGNGAINAERTSKPCEFKHATNARCSKRKNGLHGEKQEGETTEFGDSYTKFGRFFDFPTVEPTICGGNDGIPRELDGITFPKWRNESIKGYGNAIVPQVALQIFNAINLHAASYGWR